MVTERQRGAQSALFTRMSDADEAAPAVDFADGADERRRVVDRLRERWGLVRQLSEFG